jgi:CheY-like chemotaxis protein
MAHAASESQANDSEVQSPQTPLDHDILDFHRTGYETPDNYDIQFSVPQMMREVADCLRPTAESKGLALQQVAPDVHGGYEVIGDLVRLRLLLTSLLANSITFTSSGQVEFWVERKQETPDTITLSFLFKDTGRVTEDDSGHSRSPSSRRTEHGLGTSIAMVESMKGRLTFDSVPGKGTTVTLDIPFQKPPCSKTTDPDQTSPSPGIPLSHSGSSSDGCESEEKPTFDPEKELPRPQRSSITVLVVENNPHTQQQQQLTLTSIQNLGFHTASARNGEEALEYITAAAEGKRPKPGIILITDMQMTVLDGGKCTHSLRHHTPYRDYARDVPIVGMAASSDTQGDKEKSKPAGMDDLLLSKPVSDDVLERVLVRWVAHGRLWEDVAREKEKSVLKTADGEPVYCDALEIDCGGFERMMELAGPEIESADHSDWLTGKEV